MVQVGGSPPRSKKERETGLNDNSVTHIALKSASVFFFVCPREEKLEEGLTHILTPAKEFRPPGLIAYICIRKVLEIV